MNEYRITEDWAGTRIDRFVKALVPGLSFAGVQGLLRKKRVLLNGRAARGGARLSAGDTVSLDAGISTGGREPQGLKGAGKESPGRAKETESSRLVPDAEGDAGGRGAALEILHEDDAILVIDKPAGTVVQPGNHPELGSLLDDIEDYRLSKAAPREPGSGRENADEDAISGERGLPGGPAPFRWTPVHRLDRGTSGALVVAKDRRTARALSSAFREGKVQKTYLAVVEGVPGQPSGKISIPVSTRKGKRSVTVPDRAGKKAETFYRVLHRLPKGRSLLEVRITTGRTHQIRVHLASLGHPVEGDRRYGGKQRPSAGRLMLHSWKISLPGLGDAGPLEVTAPPPAGFWP